MLQIEVLLIILLAVVLLVFWREELRQQRTRLPIARVRYFWSGQERRQMERINLVLKARYQVTHNHHKRIPIESMSEDINQGGMKLIVYEKLKLGEEIELEIEIPPHEILKCKGKVAWVKDLESEPVTSPAPMVRDLHLEKRSFVIGLQFTELTPQAIERLESFVNVGSSVLQAPAA